MVMYESFNIDDTSPLKILQCVFKNGILYLKTNPFLKIWYTKT